MIVQAREKLKRFLTYEPNVTLRDWGLHDTNVNNITVVVSPTIHETNFDYLNDGIIKINYQRDPTNFRGENTIRNLQCD